jgi:hypothetical protein
MAFDPYKNTPNNELIYTGDDEIVWDRINAERLRRGLPGLAAIGYPRPESAANTGGSATVPGSLPAALPLSTATATQRLELGNLEAQRSQLISAATSVEGQVFANQQILARKAQQLANTTDPQQARVLAQEVAGLQSSIASQSQRVNQLQSQVGQLDSQIATSVTSVFGSIPGGIPAVPSLAALDRLKSLPVGVPINPAQVLKTDPATLKIPGLDQAQLTGLLGSAAASVKKIPGLAKDLLGGIGKFGASPEQLEQQGLLKPGMSQRVSSQPQVTSADIDEAFRIQSEGGDITAEQVARNRQLNSVLSSPFAWTGKNGVTDISAFDSNDSLQSVTQQDIVKSGVDRLKSLGTITGDESPEQLASLAQSAARFGASAVDLWAKGKAPPELGSAIDGVAKDAQFAVNLVDTQLPDLGVIPKSAEGAVNTVNRAAVDAAYGSLLGNPKISLPKFGGAANPNASLYANTKDEDLIYTGDDGIVWDRINAERLRRGLPSLAEIGYPRPPEDPVSAQS